MQLHGDWVCTLGTDIMQIHNRTAFASLKCKHVRAKNTAPEFGPRYLFSCFGEKIPLETV